LTSLIFHFAKGFLAKNVLMTAQRDYGLGNSLLISETRSSGPGLFSGSGTIFCAEGIFFKDDGTYGLRA